MGNATLIRMIGTGDIELSKVNPRNSFDQNRLKEMAASIKDKGILQPLVLRRSQDGKPYQLILGERRFKAAKIAGLKQVPGIVKEASDSEVLELQLIENLQRDDLNPIEEATGLKAVLEGSKYTQEKLALKIGKSQSYIANSLRLLELPDDIKANISRGIITSGHAKVMLSVKDHPKILEKVKGNFNDLHTRPSVKELDEDIQDALYHKSRQITKDQWGGGPKFDIKACAKCEHVRELKRPWRDKPERRCMNLACYNKKQKAANERLREKEKTQKGTLDLLKRNSNSWEDLSGAKFDKTGCKGCQNRKVGMHYRGKIDACLDVGCFSKKQKVGLEQEAKRQAEVRKKALAARKDKAEKINFGKGQLIQLARKIIEDGFDYHYDGATGIHTQRCDIVDAFGYKISQKTSKKDLTKFLEGLKEKELQTIIIFALLS